jgi:hypothetical protein
VAFAAAPPWDYGFAGWDFTPTMTTLLLNDPDQRAACEQTHCGGG